MARQLLFGNQELVDRLERECPDDIVTARSLDELVDRMNERNLDGLRTDLATVRDRSFATTTRRSTGGRPTSPTTSSDRIGNFRQYRGDRLRVCNFQKILDPNAMPLIAIREFILSRKSLGGIQTDLGCRVLRRRRLGDRRPLCDRRSGGLRRRRHPRHGLSGGNVSRKLRPDGTRRGAYDRGDLHMTKLLKIGARKSGAWLVRHALEQLPVTHTFGIPGVHNTEIYDELNRSEKIQPVLVTHEAGAAFAADGISRTNAGAIGTLLIVPAAGLTHAMSGIGEAFLDGIPMLVISGGTRTDVPFRYQLHELDQHALLSGLTKGSWHPKTHAEIVPAIFEAYRTAVTGVPGPVFVEIPVNLQLFQETVEDVPVFEAPAAPENPSASLLDAAVDLLAAAESPGIFVGWGAVDVADDVARIAERLGAPVSTTLQGLSAFPATHPLHTGMGFSRASVPAAENAFRNCDALLAIGTRFAEIPTGSFGCVVPENLDARGHRSRRPRRELSREGRRSRATRAPSCRSSSPGSSSGASSTRNAAAAGGADRRRQAGLP